MQRSMLFHSAIARKRVVRDGDSLVLFVCILPVLIMSLVLGIDLTHAYSAGMMQKHALDGAYQEVLVRQEEVKFSDHPDLTVRDLVAEALSRDGYIGQAKITYYEESRPRPANSATDEERHIVCEVAGARTMGAFFGAGITWPVTSSIVWTMKPYASYQVFSPFGSQSHAGNDYSYGQMFLLEFERARDGTSTYTVQDSYAASWDMLNASVKEAFNDID